MIPIPSGEMCTVCIHLHRTCSHLPFDTYKRMGKTDNEGFKIVRCEDFKKTNKPVNQCDGCQANMPIVNNIHVTCTPTDGGKLFMVCTKGKYK